LLASEPRGKSGVHQFQHGREAGKDGSVIHPTFWLIAIAALLLINFLRLGDIGKRLRVQFPTEKEQDYDRAMRDPHGHWDAHKNDKKYQSKRKYQPKDDPMTKNYRPARAEIVYMKAAAEKDREGN